MVARPEPIVADVGRALLRLGIGAQLRGRDWWARCPNRDHEDRSPSWHIRDEPGSAKHTYHHCFSCSFGGSIIDLVAYVLRVDRAAAREWVGGEGAATAALSVSGSVEVVVARPRRAAGLVGVAVAPLEEWPPDARAYATSRGITTAQISRWGIGYGYAGRLAGRIVFPKRLPTGELLGWSARTYVGDRKRYLEPGSIEAPRAVGAVFGEERWPVRRRCLMVTEGAVNALAVERATSRAPGGPWPEDRGEGVAAVSGSSLHVLQAAKMASWSKVVVVSDPDAAGDKLARELEDALGRHTRVVRAELPRGQDAAVAGAETVWRAIEGAA